MWTNDESIICHLKRLWNSGAILSSVITGKDIFPCTVPLKGPSSSELASRFGEVQDWIVSLNSKSAGVKGRGYRVESKTINHRMIGSNDLPYRIWIETLDDAVFLLGKNKDLKAFLKIIDSVEKSCPALLSYLVRHPMRALSSSGEWDRLLSVVLWMFNHNDPDIYIRQIDLPGVHTKFIEQNRAILSELLDLLLPAGSVNTSFSAMGNFARRYGFKTPPLLVRFRTPYDSGLFPDGMSDISLPAEEFAAMDINCGNVLVIENQINFLSLPRMRNTLMIWGAGYGFENLVTASWLNTKRLYYWGDIDTHGFAILNQFRSLFPAAVSFLMDRETLLEHIDLCVREPAPTSAVLHNLSNEEAALYKDIKDNLLGEQIRLEQERISYGWIMRAFADCSRWES